MTTQIQSTFSKVHQYLLELNMTIELTDESDGIFVVSDEPSGIKNLVIGCHDPLLIMEQYLFDLQHESLDIYKALLQKNRDIIHGAFALDQEGTRVIFRDTLQIESLDLNELEGSINSLALLLSEYSNEIIEFSKN